MIGEPVEYSCGYPLRPEFIESTFIMRNAINRAWFDPRRNVTLAAYNKFNETLRTHCGVASQSGELASGLSGRLIQFIN